jgi:hypothetical protein
VGVSETKPSEQHRIETLARLTKDMLLLSESQTSDDIIKTWKKA